MPQGPLHGSVLVLILYDVCEEIRFDHRVGALDYKRLVDQKLRTANDLYRFIVEPFQQGRAFVLPMVVVILVIELVFLFREKP